MNSAKLPVPFETVVLKEIILLNALGLKKKIIALSLACIISVLQYHRVSLSKYLLPDGKC